MHQVIFRGKLVGCKRIPYGQGKELLEFAVNPGGQYGKDILLKTFSPKHMQEIEQAGQDDIICGIGDIESKQNDKGYWKTDVKATTIEVHRAKCNQAVIPHGNFAPANRSNPQPPKFDPSDMDGAPY